MHISVQKYRGGDSESGTELEVATSVTCFSCLFIVRLYVSRVVGGKGVCTVLYILYTVVDIDSLSVCRVVM